MINNFYLFIRFLNRIWRWLFFLPIIVVILVLIALQDQSEEYKVHTTIYTGVISNPSTDLKENYNYLKTNNAFDNIINLSQSKTLLERISLRLLAKILINGNVNKDNIYINKEHFRSIIEQLPAEVINLINPISEDSTYNNLLRFKNSSNTNHLYKVLNGDAPYISYYFITKNLSSKRLGSSDMIQLTYKTDDPGITTYTLNLLDKLLIDEYYNLKMEPTKDIISYFEKKMLETKKELEKHEDDLQDYTKQQRIVNYEEQTKQLSGRDYQIKNALDNAQIKYLSSKNLIQDLEKKMKYQTKYLMQNRVFLMSLDEISKLSKEVATLSFVEDKSKQQILHLKILEDSLANAKIKIKNLTTDISNLEYTKEGLSKEKFIDSWLDENLEFIRAKSNIEILKKYDGEIKAEYLRLAPIGPFLERKHREIQSLETSYESMQNHLSSAKYNQKNIQMINANLNVVTNAEYPTSPEPNKKNIIIIIAYFASLFFVLTVCVITEILDRTIRDKHRAKLFMNKPILCSFPGKIDFRYRRYSMEIRRIATSYLCNKIVKNYDKNKPYLINLISQNKGEDKTLLANMIKFNFEEQNFIVKIFNFEQIMENHVKTFYSIKYNDLFKEKEEKPDIVIIINAPVFSKPINADFIQNADINLYVVNSFRSWKNTDDQNFEEIQQNSQENTTSVVLTNAKITAVEDFTNQLPPKTFFRNLTYRLLQMELISELDTNE